MIRFVHPSTFLISGPTGSGKSQFLARVLREQVLEPSPQRIIWVYAEWQPLYDSLSEEMGNIEFVKGMSKGIYDSIKPEVRNLVILDDQMAEAGSSKELSNFFTKGSHHRNLSVVYIVQNLFDKGRSMRTVGLNTQYLVVFKSPRDKSQIAFLGRQMYPGRGKDFVEVFEDATQVPFGYLLIDLRPETPEEWRLRTRIFEGEDTTVYEIGESRAIKGD